MATISGRADAVLIGERTALNFVQRMTGIATMTRQFVDAAAGRIVVLDTRKTTPLMRALEKYAVRAGGGTISMVMVNDPEMLPTQRPDRLEALTLYGEKFRLRQLYSRASTEWPTDMQVMTYPPEAMVWLRDYASPLTPLICFSESWPETR